MQQMMELRAEIVKLRGAQQPMQQASTFDLDTAIPPPEYEPPDDMRL